MPKYIVEVTEVITYTVPITAEGMATEHDNAITAVTNNPQRARDYACAVENRSAEVRFALWAD